MLLRPTLGIAMLLAGYSLSASATTLHVAASGTFGASTNTTAYSVSNGDFAFGYDMDSNPVVTDLSMGDFYAVASTNFTYTLNGVSVPAGDPGQIFYSIGTPGSLGICFSAPCLADNVFWLHGPQVYTGDVSAPMIVLGSYMTTTARFGDDLLASTSSVEITQVANAPEPSSIALLGTGMMGMAALIKRRRA